MKALDHIESRTEVIISRCPLFVTITLPKSCHRKGPKKQKEIMERHLRLIFSNYAESAIGVYELTMKGNIHAHMFFQPRSFFDEIEFSTERAKLEAIVKLLSSELKRYSISDIQIIKNQANVYKYLIKEIHVTKQILQSKACFEYQRYIYRTEEELAQKLGLIPVDTNDLD